MNAGHDGGALGAVEHRDLFSYFVLLIGLERREIKGAPSERLAGLNDFVEALSFAFAEPNRLLRAEVGTHDFEQGITAAVDSWYQTLAEDPAQGVSQPGADLFLFVGLEHAQDTIDRLAGIDCVQGAEHQVAGFGGTQSDLNGFAVAH